MLKSRPIPPPPTRFGPQVQPASSPRQSPLIQPKRSGTPPPFAPTASATAGVIQRSKGGNGDWDGRSFRNVCSYNPDLFLSYSEEEVRAGIRQMGYPGVRGHSSGGSGDNMNQATRGDLARLRETLNNMRNSGSSGSSELGDNGVVTNTSMNNNNNGTHQTSQQHLMTTIKKMNRKAILQQERDLAFHRPGERGICRICNKRGWEVPGPQHN